MIRLARRLATVAVLPLAAACAHTGDAPAGAALDNTTWRLVEVAGQPVAAPAAGERAAQLRLSAEGKRMQGYTGCNGMTSGYTLEGDALRFMPIAATRRYCADTADLETAFLQALGKATRYRIAGKQLELLAGDRVVARLAAATGG